MAEKTFVLNGTYRDQREIKKFANEVLAVNENYAKEKTLSTMGSKHKVKRHAIFIDEITEKKEESK